jgi:hypothetical protein
MSRPKTGMVYHPLPGQNYAPGKEPQSVRDAYDKHLRAQQEADADIELEADIR